MKYTKEQLNEKYKMLPKELQDVMLSSDSTENVKKIGEKHGLRIDKIGELGEEVWLTMLGVNRTSDFIRNIKAKLNLPDEKINAIAKDVNEKIFLPVRKLMMESTQKPEIKNQQEQKSNAIHHPSLTESEEIKQQVREQQTIKPVSAPPPPNLPTQPTHQNPPQADLGAHAEPKKPNLEVELPSEDKKPTHVDPYREPTE